jgi:hypothetical protein
MPVVHISNTGNNIKESSNKMNKFLKGGKDAFVLIYRDGCPPCMATHPEWLKMDAKFKKNDDIGVFDIEESMLGPIEHEGLKRNIAGVPTMRYVHGKEVEDYEDCKDIDHNRTYESFLAWIDKKATKKNNMSGGGHHIMNIQSQLNLYPRIKNGHITRTNRRKRATGKMKRRKSLKRSGGRKWSLKYKKSINCRRPRGFSQKQHCKSRRRRG